MSERTRRYLPLLKQINRLGHRAKTQLIKKCDREFLDCVSECAKNVIKSNVPLKPAQLRRLRRERKNARVLASKKTSLKKKRRILQKGGFLGALLPPVLGVLSSLLLGNASSYEVDARRSAVSGTVESRQRVQADTKTCRFGG